MSTQLSGIGDFIKRLERIAEECGERKKQDSQPKDEFVRVKQRVYTLLEQAREDIHERQALLKRRGNCYETIQKGHGIRQSLEELKRALPRLQELHKKAQNKRGAKARKEELQARYQDIRILKRHIDEVNELYLSGHDVPDQSGGFQAAPATLLGLRDTARGTLEDSRRALSGDEEEALAQMKKRDAALDSQVDEIGKVVQRLDPLARQIGEQAERQRLKAEAITDDVEKADHDIQGLNKRISEVIQYEKNTNCCCQLILGVTLLCCVGFVFQQLN
eukprot:TRINITY_DN12177_c0_g2_i1.p1 TRINITY_DN12177_c0_g2~~TRINITY_DN12177_c0_g2_i1.p1  ORF type:complete len:276 (+),score=43.57 TRINITY_DN12177_c0_g2_i1:52-879(+)